LFSSHILVDYGVKEVVFFDSKEIESVVADLVDDKWMRGVKFFVF